MEIIREKGQGWEVKEGMKVMERNFTLGGIIGILCCIYSTQYTDDESWNCTSVSYVILLAKVTK